MSLQEHRRYTVKDLYERTAFKWDLGWGTETKKSRLFIVISIALYSLTTNVQLRSFRMTLLPCPCSSLKKRKEVNLYLINAASLGDNERDTMKLWIWETIYAVSYSLEEGLLNLQFHVSAQKNDLVCSSCCPHVSRWGRNDLLTQRPRHNEADTIQWMVWRKKIK